MIFIKLIYCWSLLDSCRGQCVGMGGGLLITPYNFVIYYKTFFNCYQLFLSFVIAVYHNIIVITITQLGLPNFCDTLYNYIGMHLFHVFLYVDLSNS